MALIAKQKLYMGRQLIANVGGVVSPAMVEANGWQDLVDEDGVTPSADPPPGMTPPVKRKPSPRKKKA